MTRWTPVLLVPVLAAALSAAAGTAHYTIDPETSRVVVHVGKTGLFSLAGHGHEVVAPIASGTIDIDSGDLSRSVLRAEIDTAALQVTGRGEPADDVPEVQQRMESARVLGVVQFPRVTFESQRVEVVAREPAVRLKVFGTLTLHGVTKPEVVEATVDVGPDRITATGTFVIRQTDFGMKPVTAAGGTVRVADEIRVKLTIAARAVR